VQRAIFVENYVKSEERGNIDAELEERCNIPYFSYNRNFIA